MTDIRKKLADIRREFSGHELSKSSVEAGPLQQFEKWISEAVLAEVPEVNAMALATADAGGQPSVRIVLLKGFDNNGFSFYTNYNSRKGHELDENPKAALCFYWNDLGRQVRIRGTVSRLPAEVSDEYFATRPRGSQLGALASPQSEAVSKETLEGNMAALIEKYKEGKPIPRPAHWGGYVLKPFEVEFWQGRPNRMHDRILYTLHHDKWQIERIAP